MPAQVALFQEVFQQVSTSLQLRKTVHRRLALLVTGIIAAKSAVIAHVANELLVLDLTNATQSESIERTLRRTLADKRLNAKDCYEPILPKVIDWDSVLRGSKRVILSIDESSKEDEVHLFRVSLTFWGHTLPLASAVWQQNAKLPDGRYWAEVDAVLGRVALLLPTGLDVIVVADRFYDMPPFVDRIQDQGWHWIVRQQAKGSGRFRDRRGREYALAKLIPEHLGRPGLRWKTQGCIFKDAGWRQASMVGIWANGEDEPLVVVSDLPTRWELLEWFGRRFWIEPGFRSDKRRGWQWEDAQVKGVEHNERLLLAMAWATLVVLCVGLQEAKARLAALAARPIKVKAGRPVVGQPRHARGSLFTMGLRVVRRWLYRTTDQAIKWFITEIDAVSWYKCWYAHQSTRYIFRTVRP
jgi:hypothetical protein